MEGAASGTVRNIRVKNGEERGALEIEVYPGNTWIKLSAEAGIPELCNWHGFSYIFFHTVVCASYNLCLQQERSFFSFPKRKTEL